jgi:hypothetical protein
MKLLVALFAALLTVASTAAEARHAKHHRHYARHGAGACDGIHRCRCGTTAADKNGLPWNYKGHNLKQAREWTRAFPHTSFQVGAVGYVPRGGPTGHVFTVVGGPSCQSATVYDDAGTYARNVCGATFMRVSGGGGPTLELSAAR